MPFIDIFFSISSWNNASKSAQWILWEEHLMFFCMHQGRLNILVFEGTFKAVIPDWLLSMNLLQKIKCWCRSVSITNWCNGMWFWKKEKVETLICFRKLYFVTLLGQCGQLAFSFPNSLFLILACSFATSFSRGLSLRLSLLVDPLSLGGHSILALNAWMWRPSISAWFAFLTYTLEAVWV